MDEEVYIQVLKKLHYISAHGLSVTNEGARYIYDWDSKKSVEQNKKEVTKEDAALKYFLDIGVIDGERIVNEYRRQHMDGQEQDPPINVWHDWNTVDDAYREYEWETDLYSFNVDKLRSELKRFNLAEVGLELVNIKPEAKTASITTAFGDFTAYRDGSIRYKNKPIKLKPEVKRLVHALVSAEGRALRYDEIIEALWNEENDSVGYLDNPLRTTGQIKKRIGNAVSDANSSLHPYEDKKHIVLAGETSYKFVA